MKIDANTIVRYVACISKNVTARTQQEKEYIQEVESFLQKQNFSDVIDMLINKAWPSSMVETIENATECILDCLHDNQVLATPNTMTQGAVSKFLDQELQKRLRVLGVLESYAPLYSTIFEKQKTLDITHQCLLGEKLTDTKAGGLLDMCQWKNPTITVVRDFIQTYQRLTMRVEHFKIAYDVFSRRITVELGMYPENNNGRRPTSD